MSHPSSSSTGPDNVPNHEPIVTGERLPVNIVVESEEARHLRYRRGIARIRQWQQEDSDYDMRIGALLEKALEEAARESHGDDDS